MACVSSRRYIELYYGTGDEGDKAVLADTDIQNYWQSLERVSNVRWTPDESGKSYVRPGDLMGRVKGEGRKFNGKYNGYNLPVEKCDKAALIDQLTHTAFWVTGMHEFAGNIVEYFESPNFACTKVYKEGPDGPNTQTQADVQSYLLRTIYVSSKSFDLPLFLGPLMTSIFPGVGSSRTSVWLAPPVTSSRIYWPTGSSCCITTPDPRCLSSQASARR